MTDRLDTVTIGIQHEGAVIVGVIVRPQAGRAVVAPAARKRGRVKGVDRGAVGSAKADMGAGNGRSHLGFVGDGEFDTERPRCGTIIRTATVAEISDTYESKWAQYRVVETATALDVGYTQRDMIQHSLALEAEFELEKRHSIAPRRRRSAKRSTGCDALAWKLWRQCN
jgi:hypothetical protein